MENMKDDRDAERRQHEGGGGPDYSKNEWARHRIIRADELKRLVPYTRQHILRLEKLDRFPKRVKFGPGRVGWLAEEIEAYLRALVDKRDAA